MNIWLSFSCKQAWHAVLECYDCFRNGGLKYYIYINLWIYCDNMRGSVDQLPSVKNVTKGNNLVLGNGCKGNRWIKKCLFKVYENSVSKVSLCSITTKTVPFLHLPAQQTGNARLVYPRTQGSLSCQLPAKDLYSQKE